LIIPELAFDIITTASTRAHLTRLPRLSKLELVLSSLTPELASFFTTLPHLRQLTLTLPALHPAQLGPWLSPTHPSRSVGVVPPSNEHIVSPSGPGDDKPPLQLDSLELRARTVQDDVLDLLRGILAAEPSLASITTVHRAGGGRSGGQAVDTYEQIVYAPEAAADLAADIAAQEQIASEVEKRGDHWERTTYLKMFGGLIGIRMESRR
jgi:hypothetical protein